LNGWQLVPEAEDATGLPPPRRSNTCHLLVWRWPVTSTAPPAKPGVFRGRLHLSAASKLIALKQGCDRRPMTSNRRANCRSTAWGGLRRWVPRSLSDWGGGWRGLDVERRAFVAL